MKKAVLFIETILSFLILSTILLVATQIYSSILQTNKEELENSLYKSDLFATKLFISNQLKNAHIVNASGQRIDFYPFDKKAFLQGCFSGIVNLEESTKEILKTPKSKTTCLNSKYLIFPNNLIFEINKSEIEDTISFKNTLPNRIYEHYKILKNISSIFYTNGNLYFNSHLLQKEVNEFEVSRNGDFVDINICIANNCQKWAISQ